MENITRRTAKGHTRHYAVKQWRNAVLTFGGGGTIFARDLTEQGWEGGSPLPR